MQTRSFAEFNSAYLSCLDEIWPYWSEEMQVEIARHCSGWAPGKIDFYEYLRLSSVRFYKAWTALAVYDTTSLCDIGGFWGVWPMTAKKLGVATVAMTESLKYYGSSFDPLFDQIKNRGVEIYDYDPFSTVAKPPQTFDLVTAMAVLEHYPHSLKTFLVNAKSLMKEDGHLLLEVPNIAYWPKRIGLLKGETPLASIEDIYLSNEPFIGHHHEFTVREVRDLARISELKIVREQTFNYTLADASKLKLLLRYPIMSLAFRFDQTSRECIMVVCEANDVNTN